MLFTAVSARESGERRRSAGVGGMTQTSEPVSMRNHVLVCHVSYVKQATWGKAGRTSCRKCLPAYSFVQLQGSFLAASPNLLWYQQSACCWESVGEGLRDGAGV